MTFHQHLIRWYTANKRDLPWRNTRNPYKIWLSEIMLQQTRVDQGMPYYLRFVDKFPTVHHLAAAEEDLVMKMWQGLGYYSRARNLHATAKYISRELEGRFPDDSAQLKKLKGVGDYTAAAIASFCFGESVPVVDGNVYRLLARYFGVDIPVNSTEGVRYFRELAAGVMDRENPGTYNQAVMEFGARQCKPGKPDCGSCPLQDSCAGLQKSQIDALPVKIKKGKVRKRYFNYLIPYNNKEVLITKRKGKDIWQDLYEFPLVETPCSSGWDEVKKDPVTLGIPGVTGARVRLFNAEEVVHKLSHQHIYTKFWILELEEDFIDGVAKSRLSDYAMPVLLANFVNDFEFSN